MNRPKILAIALALILASMPFFAMAKDFRPSDLNVPDGFRADVAVTNLAAPTMVAFDDQSRMLIAESGYQGSGDPEVIRIEPDGGRTVLAGKANFGAELPVTAVAFHDNKVYIAHAGTISTVDEATKQYKDIITGLPGQGDHQVNQIIFQGTVMYFGIGTVTNSGVVGNDDYVFGWLKNPALKDLHDVPCKDITLTGQNFESENALDPSSKDKIKTGAYSPYGKTQDKGAVVKGDVKCNGAILKANADGSGLQVYAWGFRNPYGLSVGPDNEIYVTMHGFDARGSRPIENAADCFYKVDPAQWYGFPDFACDTPVTDKMFSSKDRPSPQFLIQKHPSEKPPKPIAKFDPHTAINGFAFAPSNDWGATTDVFIAEFGDIAPVTGNIPDTKEPVGIKVVRLNTATGDVSDFITNKIPGQASKHNAGGFDHPTDVTFGPDGSMYVTDWGTTQVTADGVTVGDHTGVVWRISKTNLAHDNSNIHNAFGLSVFMSILQTLILAGLTYLFATRKGDIRYSPRKGLIYGLMSTAAMLLIAVIAGIIIFRVPWYMPVQVFNILKIAPDLLNFKLLAFIIGIVTMFAIMALWGLLFAFILRTDKVWRILAGSVLYSLTVWSVMQYLILPQIAPITIEKTFPPSGFMLIFVVYGIMLGYYFSEKQLKAML